MCCFLSNVSMDRLILTIISVECKIADDERLKHICFWPGHREHFGERMDTFYKPYNSTIDQQRLVSVVRFIVIDNN